MVQAALNQIICGILPNRFRLGKEGTISLLCPILPKKLFAVCSFIRYNRHCRVPLKILLELLAALRLIVLLSALA